MTANHTASSFFSHDIFNPPNDRYRELKGDREDMVLGWLRQLMEADSDECLQWPGPRIPSGYGLLSLRGKTVGAHVFVCDLYRGPKPPDKPFATHRCGNGHLGCVNPKHLRWGSAADNADDTWYHRFLRNESTKTRKSSSGQRLIPLTTRQIRQVSSPFVVDEVALRERLQSRQRDRIVGPIQTLGTVIKR